MEDFEGEEIEIKSDVQDDDEFDSDFEEDKFDLEAEINKGI